MADHAACKAGCAKEAASNDKSKAGDSCCSITYKDANSLTDSIVGKTECVLAEGKDTVDEKKNPMSGYVLLTDGVAPDAAEEGDGNSALRVAIGSLALAATTAMLSF